MVDELSGDIYGIRRAMTDGTYHEKWQLDPMMTEFLRNDTDNRLKELAKEYLDTFPAVEDFILKGETKGFSMDAVHMFPRPLRGTGLGLSWALFEAGMSIRFLEETPREDYYMRVADVLKPTCVYCERDPYVMVKNPPFIPRPICMQSAVMDRLVEEADNICIHIPPKSASKSYRRS